MVKRIFKYCVSIGLILFLIWVLILNVKIYYTPHFVKEDHMTYNVDVYKQLQFLKSALKEGADEEMQTIYPEGFMFINALYGLGWCSFIEHLPDSSPIYEEGIEEISNAVHKVFSEKATYIFDESLHLKYGAFYMGWSTYLLGEKLRIQNPSRRNVKELALFKKRCRMIAYALDTQKSPYLESYQGSAWPADGVLAVSALNTDNKYLKGNHQEVVRGWLNKVKQHLDPNTMLIPHSVDALTGETLQGARGCSQSLMLNFLYNLDPSFANQQFVKYKDLFLDKTLGLYGVREYPKATFGLGDIDSGPVILGIGGAASIVGQRTMGLYGSSDMFDELRGNIEAFGLGIGFGQEKKYLFGAIPMMDAFFVWSNALNQVNITSDQAVRIKWKFHFISFLLIILPIFLLRKLN